MAGKCPRTDLNPDNIDGKSSNNNRFLICHAVNLSFSSKFNLLISSSTEAKISLLAYLEFKLLSFSINS